MISPYRITTDDLLNADKKLVASIQPLLDALNQSLSGCIQAVNNIQAVDLRHVTITTTANVSDSFPFRFSTAITKASLVEMNNIACRDATQPVTSPFVMNGWTSSPGTVIVTYITNLQPNQTYDLTFRVS